MTVVNPDSIAGITSVTSSGTTLEFYDVNGNLLDVSANLTGELTVGTGATISSPGANIIDFETNGDERARIDSSGRLLLGTTTEGHAEGDDLTVSSSSITGITVRSGTSSPGNIFFSDGTSGNAERMGIIRYDHNGDYMMFGVNYGEKLRIASGGNVGINTDFTGSQTWRNGQRLEIFGGGGNVTGELHLGANRGDSNQSVGSINFFDNSQDSTHRHIALIEADKSGSTSNKRGGEIIFFTKNDNVAAPTEKFRITSTGDVGINCTPHSNAGINFQIHGDNTTSEIRLTNTTTGSGNNGGTIQMGGNTLYISNSENGNTVFENNGGERLRIDSSGHMGLGIAPSDIDSIGRSLNIASSTGGAIYLQDTDAPTSKFAAISYNGGTAALQIHAHHSSSYIDFGTNGTERLRIKSTGEIHISDRNSATAGEHILQGGAFGIRMQDTGGYNRWNIERNYGGWQSDPIVHLSAQGRVGINQASPGSALNVKALGSGSDGLQVTSSGHSSYVWQIQNNDNLFNGSLAGELGIRGSSGISFSANAGSSCAVRITSAGNLNIGTNGTYIKENQLYFKASGASYIDQATTGQNLIFRTSNSSSLDVTAGYISQTGVLSLSGSTNSRAFEINAGGGAATLVFDRNGRITSNIRASDGNSNVSGGSGGGSRIQLNKNYLQFYTYPYVSGYIAPTYSEVVRITDACFYVNSSNNNITGQAAFYAHESSGAATYRPHASHPIHHFYSNAGGTYSLESYVNGNGSYSDLSDYRLKENIVSISNGISVVKQLNPVKFDWKSSAKSKDDPGFIAHEVQALIPTAVDGTKDQVKEDGSPFYQAIAQAKIIPYLTAALKESIAKIEDLEAKLAANKEDFEAFEAKLAANEAGDNTYNAKIDKIIDYFKL